MDAGCPAFLGDSPVSQYLNSPVKTSTAAKEDLKWNEEAFFKKHNLAQASESLFLPLTESSINASADLVNTPRQSLQNLKFSLNDNSFVSEGANSSLGILQVENFDLSDSSINEPIKFCKKPKSKKKLQRTSNVGYEEKDGLKEKSLKEISEAVLPNLTDKNSDESDESENKNDSSSDIEYDGTNIPELNMDCDILSLINSNKALVSRNVSLDNSNETEINNTGEISRDLPEHSFFSSSLAKHEIMKSDIASRESSGNDRQSIFENYQPSFNSLYQQLLSGKKDLVDENKNARNPQTIRVCPFLDMSSFEVEPILGKKSESSIYSDVENTRCNQNLSVDFCPEQISARSSSFRSSRQFETFSVEKSTEISDIKSRENISPSVSDDDYKSFPSEDLENEDLGGSHLQVSKTKEGFQFEGNENIENKDSGISSKSVNSDAFTEKFLKSENEFGDLGFDSQLLNNNLSSLISDGENWCSQLGISESEFFSSEAAKEILKKDKEMFEKEHMFEFSNSNKISSVSNWSPTNQYEVPAPSWLSELNSDQKIDSDRHVSVGALFSARSENVGTLSEEISRERPYFGKEVQTPPKDDTAEYDAFTTKPLIDSSEDSTMKKLRMSNLSELLDEISITDPTHFASKIVEKYNPSLPPTKSQMNSHNILNKKTSVHCTTEQVATSALSDIDDSESTLIRSASSSNVSERTDVDADCKSISSEAGQNMDNSLNCSISSSDRESIKTVKSDACSNCCPPSSQEFARSASSCSSTCSIPLPLSNALQLQYGSLNYLNSCTGTNHNCFNSANLLQQAGASGLPCTHVCAHHTLQPNLVTVGAPNSFQSVIQNTLSGQLHLSGPPALYLGIQVSSELHFPDKIALGDSQEMNLTIRNSGNVLCYYKISYLSAYLNDSPLPFEMSGLSYNNTVPCSVDNTTDVKLVLAPKYEGKIEVNLQVDAFLNSISQTFNSAPASTAKTKICFNVLRPSITMLSKGKDILNIGHVVAGSTFVEYITVINNCEVSVPLRISLSNYSLEDQIYFGLKEMNRQKHATSGGLRFLSPKTLLYRMPASKNKSFPSTLEIPVVFESINGRIDSTISAAIETPTLSEVLAFIKVTADGGNAKLVLKDCNQNPLILKAYKGATCNHSLTVINAGNLPVVYDIYVDGDNDVLSVSPSSLNLQPNQCSTISVTFTPSTYHSVKGNLLAAAEPHGQVFSVTEIIGQVKENSVKSHLNIPQLPSSKPTRDSTDFASESSSLIECNKKYLAWGGVDIGEASGLKTCIIRNPNQNTVQVRLFIKTCFQEFLLIDDSGKKTSIYELTLTAKEEKVVSVTFIPKRVVSYSGLLCIKLLSENNNRLFTVTLSGYGGKSNLKVLGLSEGERTGYCLDVEASNETDIVYKNIIFHNVGYRPAFVKLLITYDNIIQNPVEKQTVIHPSEFVLLENEKKNILVSMNCLNKNFLSNNEVISILYGDEVMRQRLRRLSKSSSSKNLNLAYNINFSVPYEGEDKVLQDSSYKSSPKDESLFYTHLKKVMIHIFYNGQNTSFSRMSFGALSEIQESFSNMTLNSTISNRRLTIEGHLQPVKESSAFSMPRLSLPAPFDEDPSLKPAGTDSSASFIADYLQDVKFDSWIVQPEELTIDAVNKDKRILLKSYSDIDLRFKVEWAIDVITVSPVSGTLLANGEIGLRFTLINTNHSKLFEDSYENIKITCNGIEKNVKVTIMKDCKKNRGESLLQPVLNDSLRSGFLGDSFYMDNTLVELPSSYLNIENIFNFPKVIDLQRTRQTVLSETILVVCNPTKFAVTWSIHPTTMLFTQPFDDSIDSASSAIEFLPSSGVLKSSETSNIGINFLPRSVAVFSQFFELVLDSQNCKKQICSIKVQGEAVADYHAILESRKSEIGDKKPSAAVKKRAKAEIVCETEICKFPMTASGQKSTLSVTIKNISYKDNKLTIQKPILPFVLKYSTLTLKSRKFLTIPVHFKPQTQGSYESEIIFVSENGFELKIKLMGTCSV